MDFETPGSKREQVGECTDGDPSMLGCRSVFKLWFSKNQGEVIKTANFIKANVLESRWFSTLCKEGDYEFETLFLYSHIRELSKEKTLKRVFVLSKEIEKFLADKKPDLSQNSLMSVIL
ncbi:protein FAM200A-like [Palaemon carinicauda]|uniref:protein FAM200A-like n=1 Tax=Palaemon carinicauda TaxID=392227 RepID=UPI0035B5D525